MLINVAQFGERCNFLPEAMDALITAANLLDRQEDAAAVFGRNREQLFSDPSNAWKDLDAFIEKSGIHRFTVHQLFLIYCAEETKIRYQAAGYPEQLYWDTMKDLKYKMEETHKVYGVWGVYCGPWLAHSILLRCFCLGRLQFEVVPSDFSCELAGHVLQSQDKVINVHIPSFGKLGYEDVLDAYSRAAKFFGHLFPDGAVWFRCKTWMLYPPVNALLSKGNIKRFFEDFNIVHAFVDPNVDDRYRIFMVPSDVPVTEYPENSTLQRNLKAWLLEGNSMGLGVGFFLWKDGKVVPHG